MEYQAGDIPNYTSSDASVCFLFFVTCFHQYIFPSEKLIYIYSNVFLQVRIQKDCEVLLKITTVSVVATEIVRTIPITLFIMQLK